MSDDRIELCPHVRVVERNGSGNGTEGISTASRVAVSTPLVASAHTREAQNETGPLVGVKAGGDDDAIHFHGEVDGITVCGLDATTRNIARRAGDVDCWTCQRWGLADRERRDA